MRSGGSAWISIDFRIPSAWREEGIDPDVRRRMKAEQDAKQLYRWQQMCQIDIYAQLRRIYERASLGKAYDDACEEEDTLYCMYSEVQERRLEIGRRFELQSTYATTRLFYAVMRVTELRNVILSPLLTGEVSAFLTGCDMTVDKRDIATDLSPLEVILSGSKRLQRAFKEGYNLTLISGTEDDLLYGLSGQYLSPWQISRTRHWSAILIATKNGKCVPCSADFLPLSEFGNPHREADSVEDRVTEDWGPRTVLDVFGDHPNRRPLRDS